MLQEDDSLTKEQIADQIRKIKESHAEDEGTPLLANVYVGLEFMKKV